ncbi:bifunctional biotin--[acetyl-CoA-carboxylase] ligase/biotin operon repressor BirA [Vibrio salinus]|uniref:bifunctional biotin--[acetyl-CoA-carboxylase] ligase/biotin operon repressor BirA n=1 Tax=Vibrio salinus TaxID=2899784 RepID=UPI001E3FB311|nr:bifunctional biotin--[acetyl-CoA-carboxylase] ligase/biotin operon repressor BirA [Vibrio salinus]MCE0493513.1 bifunctional biotin--[acetyl-CoA-carboxylase] ligase/biotin operon repressor BirA [Vibrio salinus]
MKDHSVKIALLKTLSDGAFYSGEALGISLGISRAAISKHIKGIQEWGVDIFRIQGKGYQLAKPMNLLNEVYLKQRIHNPLYLYPVIDSTNQFLMDRTDSLESGTVCLAEYQENGRGRRGRQWYSPFGSNLYLSMYWNLEAGIAGAMGLSLVAGIAVIDALESLGISGVKLKWPNDLYFNDKKLAGILVEMSGQAGGSASLIVGMGMNLSMQVGNSEIIDQPWSCLSDVLDGESVDRNKLAVEIISCWNNALEEYEFKGMSSFVARWNQLDNFIDRSVKLLIGKREICGIDKGIDSRGAIILETEQGIESYIGGEISLRKNDL